MKFFTLRRRLASLTALTLVFAAALAGCASDGGAGSPAPSAPVSQAPAADPSQSPGADPSQSPSGTAAQQLIQAGTWLSDQGMYWFFDAGEASGRTAGLEDGTGIPFAYTYDGAQAVFSMGIAGNDFNCDVTAGENTLTFQWEDGTTEVLTYVSDQSSDQFRFYSNQELCDLALTYYKAQNSAADTDGLQAASQTNEDGTVTIQIYENLGDHNSNAAWYTVDRITGQGTDSTGAQVDLSK